MSLLTIRLSEMIGLTILHSLWQITMLWVVLIALLSLWPKASSAVRYTLAISTLVLSVLTTAATAIYEWQSHATIEAISVLPNGTTQTLAIEYSTATQTLLSRITDAVNTSVPVFAWLWCAGLVVMSARFGGSFFYLGTLRAQENIEAISPVWKQELKRLSGVVGLRCEVAIATSARVSSPLTLGSISPIILLPAGLLSGLSTAQIEAILVHELYHIKRRDYLINICQALVEVILFYHPAIWHINNIIREERENCCDDQTLAFCGDAITYARALTQIQEINTLTKPTLTMSATGPNAGNFSNRIKRLFNIYPNPAQARSKGIFAIGFLIVYFCIVLASAKVLTAEPVEPEKRSAKKSVDDHNSFSNILSDSIPVSNLYVTDAKKETSQPAVGEEVHSSNAQRADTIVSERTLDNCLKQVRLLLKMTSIYGLPGESLRFSQFSADDSLRINLKLQPSRFYRPVNLLRRDEVAKDVVLEKIHRDAVDSVTIYNSEQAMDRYDDDGKNDAVTVRVFPNSTNGHLSISFTPPRDNSRVKIVLIDLGGTLVKEITDSTYDNVPTALYIDLSSYKKGIYILQINIDGAKSHQRVVVE
jgi:beta-lactamase regulating signal transducer with metallopeptidase domain